MVTGRWRQFAVFGLAAMAILSGIQPVYAVSPTSNSAHYQVSDTQFGSSSTSQTCSGQYCATAGVGGTNAGGDAASASYGATFGPVTSSDPLLEVIVDPGVSDLGNFDSSHASTKTMSVKIRNYLSSGYILQITGTPPHTYSHTIGGLSSPTSSQPGTEQFGINAVANTTPNVGADPLQVPSGSFSFGQAATGYDTANKFQYKSGDTVAQSTKASGETDFTITMLVNVSNTTPAGQYSGDFSAVVIPSY
jgi:hypothetical protein